VVLPLRRIVLSGEDTSKPIPTLSDRQFVVAKDKLSTAELYLQRELFWYREALFKSIHGHWKEVCSGDLSCLLSELTEIAGWRHPHR
jgi:hypothetical protein